MDSAKLVSFIETNFMEVKSKIFRNREIIKAKLFASQMKMPQGIRLLLHNLEHMFSDQIKISTTLNPRREMELNSFGMSF